MKRILSILIGIFIAIPTFASVYINGLYYELDEIFHTASVARSNPTGDVNIPDKIVYAGVNYDVTSIGQYAFRSCSSLTSITIPSSVTSIGQYAFLGCSSLTSITIPSSGQLTSIGDYAFYNCSSLTSITIPNSVISIGRNAFYGCSALTSITIPSSGRLTSIGDYVFAGCSRLTSITIPSSVTSISNFAFYACSSLTSITLHNSLTSIFSYAFSGCSSLVSITIPSSVTSIGENAFGYCSKLKRVEISSLTTWCNIKFSSSSSNPLSNGSHLFLNDVEIVDLEIPEDVNSINPYAFYGCQGFKSVKFSSSVKSIGSSAFWGCSSLNSITLPSSVTSIGSSAFLGCSGLTSVTLPSSVTSIGDGAFWGCSGLTSITLPSSGQLKSIGSKAFFNCSSLTSITLPNSVTSIGSHAFYDCNGLTSITIPNSVTSIGDYAFYYCKGLSGSLEIGNSAGENGKIGGHAFHGCENLESLKIGNSVSTIGILAFSGCTGLGNVTMGGQDNLKIDDDAFKGCSFDKLVINRPLSFYNNSSLSKIFPQVSHLELGGYYDCSYLSYTKNTELQSVKINSTFSDFDIPSSAFEGCTNLSEVSLSESVKSIGNRAFRGTAIKEIAIPSLTIGDEAFANTELKEVSLGYKVEKIGEHAFDTNTSPIPNIYSAPIVPPAASTNTFSQFKSNVYVPAPTKFLYEEDRNCWFLFGYYGSFQNLVEPESLSIKSETAVNQNGQQTIQLTATLMPEDVTMDKILWSSTNPEIATVDNDGLVTVLKPQSEISTYADVDSECEIIATTMYAQSPEVRMKVQDIASGISEVFTDAAAGGSFSGNRSNDVYNFQGVCVKRNATQSDIDALSPGLYIIGGKKVLVK